MMIIILLNTDFWMLINMVSICKIQIDVAFPTISCIYVHELYILMFKIWHNYFKIGF